MLAQHCVAAGRDAATIARSTAVNGEGEGADALTTQAEALAGLGITLLTVGTTGPDYDLTKAEALCRWRDNR